MTRIAALRCEYAQNPLGIDCVYPRFYWRLEASQRGARQSAYQILVASSPEALAKRTSLLWDSGKVLSEHSTHIAYAGLSLQSRQRVWWQVRIWDEQGQVSDYSEPAWWEMGLLQRDDWRGQWMVVPEPEQAAAHFSPHLAQQSGVLAEEIERWQHIQAEFDEKARPCPLVRKEFRVGAGLKQARLYATARGLYLLSLNGQRVGDDYFRPGWTDYHQRLQYQTYDVTSLLVPGENALGVILGDGWYRGVMSWLGQRNFYGQSVQALVQLELEYSDGSREVVVSDESWKTATGALQYSDMLMGEAYDARLEQPGWDQAGFDEAHWQAVTIQPLDATLLVAQYGPGVQKVAELTPQQIRELQPGTYLVDLGQNMVGWMRLRVTGPAGTTVQLRFGEMLQADGTLYTENLRTARATDLYTLKGEGEEVYEPHFTFHGFRYVEVTGYPGQLTNEHITGIVVQTPTPPTGSLLSSNAMLNQLVHNIEWGQRGNFLEVPTDCPQRDERLGWMGDAQIFARTATYNADVAAFFTRWLSDVADAQSPEGWLPNIVPSIIDPRAGAPAWSDAGIIVPWTLYLAYGDTRLLARQYTSMTRWLEFLVEANPDGRWRKRRNGGGEGQWDFGDWLSIEAETPKDVIADAFFAHSAALLAKIARVLGREDDAMRYDKLFARIQTAFQTSHITPDGRVAGETQTGYVLALRFGLMPEALRPIATQHLVEDIQRRGGHLSTGFVGVAHLLPTLTENGRVDVAYQLLLKDTFPSWGYSIRHGATTIWERWDGWTAEKGFQTPLMNSFNHYSFGSVGEWLYRYAAGIETQEMPEPAFKQSILRPFPDPSLQRLRAVYDSIHGRIVSAWAYEESTFTWQIELPPNTTATVYVPAAPGALINDQEPQALREEGLTFVRREENAAVYTAQAGHYQFTVSM
ncbi:alpha-L-rhamnosidase [Ktedonobacter sp. SOSP1-85]|uniref:alpha-L-rhamnosidase n=1 Tax=Ktedonobacter sp. SOSP1-85 TaxID=2778367 RepID=UPI001914DB90|nr:alpha-L-rhamnosidase [Ktedonobacter sp. SOSP1-85]GHO72798.1 alpha-L-rhamnosidase [Ktedonobacter sp. SOSP1-85]